MEPLLIVFASSKFKLYRKNILSRGSKEKIRDNIPIHTSVNKSESKGKFLNKTDLSALSSETSDVWPLIYLYHLYHGLGLSLGYFLLVYPWLTFQGRHVSWDTLIIWEGPRSRESTPFVIPNLFISSEDSMISEWTNPFRIWMIEHQCEFVNLESE